MYILKYIVTLLNPCYPPDSAIMLSDNVMIDAWGTSLCYCYKINDIHVTRSQRDESYNGICDVDSIMLSTEYYYIGIGMVHMRMYNVHITNLQGVTWKWSKAQ